MADEPDFAAEGLLDGLQDEREREARLDLLRRLHADGVSLEELRRAVAEDRLALLPVEHVFAGENRYTLEDLARESGLEVEFLERERRALGLSAPERDARVFGEDDLEAARGSAAFAGAGIGEEQRIEVQRVVGSSMARIAAAMRASTGQALARPGDTERDLGLRIAEFARFASDNWADWLSYVLQQHMLDQLRRDAITRAELESGRLIAGAQEDVGVAFADLVGFTRMGERRPVDELGAVAERLAELAADVSAPPVRLVKTIGDAAMLVSREPQPLLDATLALVEAAEREGDEFPQLRAGVALGPALGRRGDWYGHTVNVASRVTGVARPNSVLTTEPVHDALAEHYRWSFAGLRKLKNVREPVRLYRARPAQDGEGEADSG
jgi:adenylate cyclase